MPIVESLVAAEIFCAGFYAGVSFLEIRQLHGDERTEKIRNMILILMVALLPAAIWIWTLWEG